MHPPARSQVKHPPVNIKHRTHLTRYQPLHTRHRNAIAYAAEITSKPTVPQPFPKFGEALKINAINPHTAQITHRMILPFIRQRPNIIQIHRESRPAIRQFQHFPKIRLQVIPTLQNFSFHTFTFKNYHYLYSRFNQKPRQR
jgi:hypothetical protein